MQEDENYLHATETSSSRSVSCILGVVLLLVRDPRRQTNADLKMAKWFIIIITIIIIIIIIIIIRISISISIIIILLLLLLITELLKTINPSVLESTVIIGVL